MSGCRSATVMWAGERGASQRGASQRGASQRGASQRGASQRRACDRPHVWTAVGLVGLWDVGLVMGGWKAGDGRLWADDGRLEGWRWSAVNPFPDSSCVKTSERWAGGWVGGGKSGA